MNQGVKAGWVPGIGRVVPILVPLEHQAARMMILESKYNQIKGLTFEYL